MSVAISDVQAVSFTRCCLEGKTFGSDGKKNQAMKLACSEERERWMTESQIYPFGIRVHFAQWLQNIKQAASYNFWMLYNKNMFLLKTGG